MIKALERVQVDAEFDSNWKIICKSMKVKESMEHFLFVNHK